MADIVGINRVGRRVASGVATAGMSVAGGFTAVLVDGRTSDAEAGLRLAAGLVLVAVATFVGTMWSGRAVGLVAGTLPFLAIAYVALEVENDSMKAVAGFFYTAYVAMVAAAGWGLTSIPALQRRKVRPAVR